MVQPSQIQARLLISNHRLSESRQLYMHSLPSTINRQLQRVLNHGLPSERTHLAESRYFIMHKYNQREYGQQAAEATGTKTKLGCNHRYPIAKNCRLIYYGSIFARVERLACIINGSLSHNRQQRNSVAVNNVSFDWIMSDNHFPFI